MFFPDLIFYNFNLKKLFSEIWSILEKSTGLRVGDCDRHSEFWSPRWSVGPSQKRMTFVEALGGHS